MNLTDTIKGSLLEGFFPAGWDLAKIDACVGDPGTVLERQPWWNKGCGDAKGWPTERRQAARGQGTQVKRKEGAKDMAKALTKSQIMTKLADKMEMTKKDAGLFVEAMVELAYKEAKNGFTIPGLGKLVLVRRKARIR